MAVSDGPVDGAVVAVVNIDARCYHGGLPFMTDGVKLTFEVSAQGDTDGGGGAGSR